MLAATCGHDATAARLYLIDSKPIPFCHPVRHGRVRLLREDGARFGKTSKGWFFGFKSHALRHISGRVLSLLLTPANYDDRKPALALADGVEGGVVIGDLGYRGPECAAALADEAELLLITRADAPDRKFLLSQVRQGVETMFTSGGISSSTVCSAARGRGCGTPSSSRCCVTTWFMPASCRHDLNSRLGLS